MSTFSLKILTPRTTFYDGLCHKLLVATCYGQQTILDKHASMLSLLEPGFVELQGFEGLIRLFMEGGFMRIDADAQEVILLCDAAEMLADLDMEKAQTAVEQTEQAWQDFIDTGGSFISLEEGSPIEVVLAHSLNHQQNLAEQKAIAHARLQLLQQSQRF